MHRHLPRLAAASLALLLAPAPPAAAQTAAAQTAAAPAQPPARRGYTGADVRFMRAMIAHHAQALTMAALVPARTSSEAMKLLAERITLSQETEIALMRRWLRERGESAPDSAHVAHMAMGHDMPGMAGDSVGMPGMASAEELAGLAAAKGRAFDRLFLTLMIRHHEGALTMVRALFASPGAAQESEMYRFASDVGADQRAEIARMRALLGAL